MYYKGAEQNRKQMAACLSITSILGTLSRLLGNCNHRNDTYGYSPMDTSPSVTEKQMRYLARQIYSYEARALLLELGLDDVTIDHVFDRFKTDCRERVYQGLRKCQTKMGRSGFTFGILVKALNEMGRKDLIEEITAGIKSRPLVISVLPSGIIEHYVESEAELIQSMVAGYKEKIDIDKGGGHGYLTHVPGETLK